MSKDICRLLIVSIILLICVVGKCASAEAVASDDLIHFAAHFGMSFAINTIVYETARKPLQLTDTQSTILAIAITAFVGIMYKYLEVTPNGAWPSDTGRSLLYNGLGIGASYVVLHF